MHPFQQYLNDMRAIKASGHGTAETSYYGPLATLMNAAGDKLRPRVLCVMQGRDIGAGLPDVMLWMQTSAPSSCPQLFPCRSLSPGRKGTVRPT